ncbi:hypothetical protein AMTRI_Chr10g229670 [Amborella trichopoda]
MIRQVIIHFKKIFIKEVKFTPKFDKVPFKVLPNHLKCQLEREVTIKGVQNAVFALSSDKAPGPDGDLLSPFLFTIYAECFSLMLSKVERVSHFSGFKIADAGMTISHLQYADDTLIFCDVEILQVKNIARFLECCKVTLGLKVNFHKSSMVGINCSQTVVDNLANAMGCKVDFFPVIYLGILISDFRHSLTVWDMVIERVQLKLDLSLGGRVTLANLLVYQMS